MTTWPRRFHLQRDFGDGHETVAHGCMWNDHTCAVRWLSEHPSTILWADIADAYAIHCPDARTRLDFIDLPDTQPPAAIAGARWPTRFHLQREHDVTGISGTGTVATGAVFTDGTAVMRWDTTTSSIGVYNSLADLQTIHGHNGATRVVLVDQWHPKESSSMAMSRKHYRETAALLKSAAAEPENETIVREIAAGMASMFFRDNSRFSRQRFFDAIFDAEKKAA
ncbi:hypothetical protein ABZ543_12685 [Streptomyces roseifaciens]